LAVAALLVGCTDTARTNSSAANEIGTYEQQLQSIAQREQTCEQGVAARVQNQAPPASSTAGAAASSEQLIAECKAQAQKEDEQLASRQRSAYEQGAREERNRASLIMTLTTSPQH
jgi:hypothetical protein